MMPRFLIQAAIALIAFSIPAFAAERVIVLTDAALYRTAEQPAAITGAYTIVPNATPGFASNISYIRFINVNPSKATVASVRIIGNATGDYGTAIVNSPPRSSPQLSLQDLLALANGGTFDPTDTRVTLYLQSSDFLTGVQHVYFNIGTGFFENMSVCAFEDGLNYVPMTSLLANVHSSILSGNYPSTVEVHNKKSTAAAIRLRIHDGRTGTLRGIFQFNAAANTSYTFSAQQIEAAIAYTPGATDYHMNVIIDGDPSTPSNVVLSHSVQNLRVPGAPLNLTTVCGIDEPVGRTQRNGGS